MFVQKGSGDDAFTLNVIWCPDFSVVRYHKKHKDLDTDPPVMCKMKTYCTELEKKGISYLQ